MYLKNPPFKYDPSSDTEHSTFVTTKERNTELYKELVCTVQYILVLPSSYSTFKSEVELAFPYNGHSVHMFDLV